MIIINFDVNIIISMTVCPPEGTKTNLNMDLLNAEKVTLDEDTRVELRHLSVEWLDDHEVGMIIDDLRSTKEENLWRNWYQGYSTLELPYILSTSNAKNYRIYTTAVPGGIIHPLLWSTPDRELIHKEFETSFVYQLSC